jgi:hypothetical protein
LAAFDATLPLLDCRVRLANDMSGAIVASGGDRDDGKTNSYGLLVPPNLSGVGRASALMHATFVIRDVCRRLDSALAVEMDKLAQAWPLMGQWVARGRILGVKAYEVGHYTTLSTDAFTGLLEAS